jgi:hypothetical protein
MPMTEQDHTTEQELDSTTTDLGLAAFLLTYHDFVLTEIAGPAARRRFRFDRPIPRDLVLRFQSSPERRLLDCVRNLKVALKP